MTMRPIADCHSGVAWRFSRAAPVTARPRHVIAAVAGLTLVMVATAIPSAPGLAHKSPTHGLVHVLDEEFAAPDEALPGEEHDGRSAPNYSPHFDDDDVFQDPFTRRDDDLHDVPQGCPYRNKKKLELMV